MFNFYQLISGKRTYVLAPFPPLQWGKGGGGRGGTFYARNQACLLSRPPRSLGQLLLWVFQMFFSEVFARITTDCNQCNGVLLYFPSVVFMQFTQQAHLLQSKRTVKTSSPLSSMPCLIGAGISTDLCRGNKSRTPWHFLMTATLADWTRLMCDQIFFCPFGNLNQILKFLTPQWDPPNKLEQRKIKQRKRPKNPGRICTVTQVSLTPRPTMRGALLPLGYTQSTIICSVSTQFMPEVLTVPSRTRQICVFSWWLLPLLLFFSSCTLFQQI